MNMMKVVLTAAVMAFSVNASAQMMQTVYTHDFPVKQPAQEQTVKTEQPASEAVTANKAV